jgi:hypothetical protein
MKTKTTKTGKEMYRQGDVLIMRTDEIPSDLVKTNKCTLALGEATGHHHTIFDNAIGYASSIESLAEYFEVTNETADLVHQEHDTIQIPNGKWKAVIQVEYTPEELKNVAD